MSYFQLDNQPVLAKTKSQTLGFALLFAALFHGLILWYLKTPDTLATKITQTIEVSLSAQPLIKPINHQASSENQPNARVIEKPTSANKPLNTATKPVVNSTKKPETVNPIAVKKPADVKSAPISSNPAIIPTSSSNENKPKLSAEDLQQQISQYGKNIVNTAASFEDKKIKLVNEVKTHKVLMSQYVQDWDDKIERTGNMNYPEAARHLKQSLTMEIGIKVDGSIYSINIVKSSGNTSLDEAAKRIVKMSAPFAELPVDIQQEVNVLVITRVWKFSDETGMTTR